MLTEICGKGGNVCRPAKQGEIRCPLIVRPTSEDSITGNLFQVLRAINPRWWLPDLLNQALGTDRFRRQVFRNLQIELWKSRPAYPRDMLPWNEGSTEVDVTITWENPPTTVFIEVKYMANLSTQTTHDDGASGFSDQLTRNVRVGLLECGWFQRSHLFQVEPRDFVFILLSPTNGNRLVERYRDTHRLRGAIPHNSDLIGLPRTPFIGELTFGEVSQLVNRKRRWLSRAERLLADDLTTYLGLKMSRSQRSSPRDEIQRSLLS